MTSVTGQPRARSAAVGRHRRGPQEAHSFAERVRGLLLRWPPSPHVLLVAVAVVYCVAVVALTKQAMILTYDESVYASQVARNAPAARFSAPRARGMSLLVAPVVALTQSPVIMRFYLVIVAGALMYVAFRPWLAVFARVGGRYRYVPPVAAAAFSTLWITVLYGDLAYPNLWLAFVLVAGVGYLIRAVTELESGWRPVIGVAATFAAASLLRPTDASAVAAPLLVALVVLRAWRRPRVFVALVVGLLVGWGAWVAEAFARFGGPLQRLAEGGDVNESGLTNSIPQNLASLDGPEVLCRPTSVCAEIVPAAVVWWLLIPVLVAVGLVVAGRSRWLTVGVVTTASAATLAGQYFFLIDYAAPRFLLPAYGLLAILVAAAVIWCTAQTRGRTRTLVYASIIVVLLAHGLVQGWVLVRAQHRLQAVANGDRNTAQFLQQHGVHAPCLIWGANAIQLSYQLNCTSIPAFSSGALPDENAEAAIVHAAEQGQSVAVRLAKTAEPPAFLSDWRREEVPNSSYVIYLPIAQ